MIPTTLLYSSIPLHLGCKQDTMARPDKRRRSARTVYIFARDTKQSINNKTYHYGDTITQSQEGRFVVKYHGQPRGYHDAHMLNESADRYVYRGDSRELLGKVESVRVLDDTVAPKVYELTVAPVDALVANDCGVEECMNDAEYGYGARPLSYGVRMSGPRKKIAIMKTLGVSWDSIRSISFNHGIVPVF